MSAFVMKVKLEIAVLLVLKLDAGGLIGGRIKQLIGSKQRNSLYRRGTGCENDLDTNIIQHAILGN